MLQPIGTSFGISGFAALSNSAASSLQSANTASSQAIQDLLNISPQAQAAAAQLDSDGDHDGS